MFFLILNSAKDSVGHEKFLTYIMCYSNSLQFFSSFVWAQKQTLMQHILRCDYEACRQYLMNLEQAVVLEQNLQMLQTFISHRCDGNRNILHACVSVCFPTSNKETKEEEGEIKNYVKIFKKNFRQFWKYNNY